MWLLECRYVENNDNLGLPVLARLHVIPKIRILFFLYSYNNINFNNGMVKILVLPAALRPIISVLICLRLFFLAFFFCSCLLLFDSAFGVDFFFSFSFLVLGFSPPSYVLLRFLPSPSVLLLSFWLSSAPFLDFDSLCLEKKVNFLFLFFPSSENKS